MEVDPSILSVAAHFRFSAPAFSRGRRQGDRRGRATGQGQEFADFRPYHPGDDLRRVDWNAYQRLDSVLLRLSHEDRDQRILLAVDATGSMRVDRKADYAATLTAGLALSGLLARDHVSLGLLCEQPQLHTVGDVRSFPALRHAIEHAQPGGQAPLGEHLLRWSGGRRFDRALLLSDLLVEPREAEQTLSALATISDHPTVLHVLAPADISPVLNGSLELEDAETGERVRIEANSEIQAAYQQAYTRWEDGLQRLCRRYNITRVLAPTSRAVGEVMTKALPRIGVLTMKEGGGR